MNMSVSKFWEMLKDREAWCAAAHGVAKSQTWLSDYITTKKVDSTKKTNKSSDRHDNEKKWEKAYITRIMNKKVSLQILQSIETTVQ